MKILIDMNLSPEWTKAFAAENIESVHWSNVGDPRAEDEEIMEYARRNDFVVFTHDLDFGALLALTQARKSKCRAGSRSKHPAIALAKTVISVLRSNETLLEQGALIVVDEARARVRILPLQKHT